MNTLASEAGFLFINIFKVEPSKQEELAQILKESVEVVISKQPGYLGNQILKSKDGNNVVVLARWESPQNVEATRNAPQNAPYLKLIQELGAQPSPGIYDVFFSESKNG